MKSILKNNTVQRSSSLGSEDSLKIFNESKNSIKSSDGFKKHALICDENGVSRPGEVEEETNSIKKGHDCGPSVVDRRAGERVSYRLIQQRSLDFGLYKKINDFKLDLKQMKQTNILNSTKENSLTNNNNNQEGENVVTVVENDDQLNSTNSFKSDLINPTTNDTAATTTTFTSSIKPTTSVGYTITNNISDSNSFNIIIPSTNSSVVNLSEINNAENNEYDNEDDDGNDDEDDDDDDDQIESELFSNPKLENIGKEFTLRDVLGHRVPELDIDEN